MPSAAIYVARSYAPFAAVAPRSRALRASYYAMPRALHAQRSRGCLLRAAEPNGAPSHLLLQRKAARAGRRQRAHTRAGRCTSARGSEAVRARTASRLAAVKRSAAASAPGTGSAHDAPA